MARTLVQQRLDAQEREHAFQRVRGLLALAAVDDAGTPVLSMIIKHHYRETGGYAVQVLVVTMPSGSIIDISSEVAQIIGERYSRTHRGLMIVSIGEDIRNRVMASLAAMLYGHECGQGRFALRMI